MKPKIAKEIIEQIKEKIEEIKQTNSRYKNLPTTI